MTSYSPGTHRVDGRHLPRTHVPVPHLSLPLASAADRPSAGQRGDARKHHPEKMRTRRASGGSRTLDGSKGCLRKTKLGAARQGGGLPSAPEARTCRILWKGQTRMLQRLVLDDDRKSQPNIAAAWTRSGLNTNGIEALALAAPTRVGLRVQDQNTQISQMCA